MHYCDRFYRSPSNAALISIDSAGYKYDHLSSWSCAVLGDSSQPTNRNKKTKETSFTQAQLRIGFILPLPLSTPSTMLRTKQPQRGAMRSSQPPKRPAPPKKPGSQVNQGGIHAPKSHWPVWKMNYRAEGVSKILRIEWHHEPNSQEAMNETLSVIHEYICNPCDEILSFHGRGFKDLKPEFCIVT